MTWTNNFSKTFFIFAWLIPFFWLFIPKKCFYQWILCHNVVYMKKVPWFFKLKFWAGGQAELWQESPHHGDSVPSWWPQCTGADSAAPPHTRHPQQTCKQCLIICRHVSNVQVKWLILPQCSGGPFNHFCKHGNGNVKWNDPVLLLAPDSALQSLCLVQGLI